MRQLLPQRRIRLMLNGNRSRAVPVAQGERPNLTTQSLRQGFRKFFKKTARRDEGTATRTCARASTVSTVRASWSGETVPGATQSVRQLRGPQSKAAK